MGSHGHRRRRPRPGSGSAGQCRPGRDRRTLWHRCVATRGRPGPRGAARQGHWRRRCPRGAERGDAIVINDIPLLFEVLDPAQFDIVVLIDSPVALRRTRLRALRGLSNQDADRMIAAQMPAARKRPQSQHVIDNAGTLAELEKQAQRVFADLRKRAAHAGVQNEAPGQTLLLCALDARDAAAPVLQAIERRYRDAGMRVEHTTVKGLAKTLKAGTPLSIVATAQAAEGARAAWEAAVPPRPCRLYHLSPDPDPVAVRLDLRPWGDTRVALSEEDGAGLAPRADLL